MMLNSVNEPLIPTEELVSPNIIRYLYIGHFLARWDARMWEFSVGLYMINIWPESLLFTAIYGLVESASTAIFGPIVGQCIDRLTYVKILRIWLVSQNLSFVVAGVTVVVLLVDSAMKSTNFAGFIFLVILTNVSGAVGVLSTLAGTILIEREWVVVISEGHSEGQLTKMNTIFRRIDLTCKLCAPVVTGFIISFVSFKASALTLAIWNSISIWIEYWLFISVYNKVPALQESSQRRALRSSTTRGDSNISYLSAWIVYLKQDVLIPGIALALLYFTVLSFGTLMTASLEWEGIPVYIIGIARGISAVIGIGATIVYPILQSRISTLRTGLWSIWSQWLFLLVCVVSIWIQNRISSAYILMAGVALSRLGLWSFDLSVIQQMQDHVAEPDRGVVGGVQNSLQSIMDLMAYVMGILISNPQEFWKLNVISFGAVTLAAILYSYHIYRVRKHLLHYEKLFIFFGKMAQQTIILS